jgi:LPXTG-motif cell wall-anchored protein
MLQMNGVEVTANDPHLDGCDFTVQWENFGAAEVISYSFRGAGGGVTIISGTVTMDGAGFAQTAVHFNETNLAALTPQAAQGYHITFIGDNADPNANGKNKTFWIEKGCGEVPPPPPPPLDLCPNIDGDQETVPLGMITNDAGECVPPQDACPNLQGVQDAPPAGWSTDADGNCVPPAPADVCPNIDGAQDSVPNGYEVDADGNCVLPAEIIDDCPNLSGHQNGLPEGYTFSDGDCVKVLGNTFNADPDEPEVKAEDAKPEKKKILPFTGSESAPLVALGSLLLMSGLGFLFLQRKSDQLDF